MLLPWTGDGQFEDGETEDYLVLIHSPNPDIKWEQPPNPSLPGLHAHDWCEETLQWRIVLADDWLCQGGDVTDLHWWGNYELDATDQEIRGAGIQAFHLSIHGTDPQGLCLPGDPPLWSLDVPFASVNETNAGLFNSEGGKIYRYEYVLTDPFLQTAGQSYWLDITARAVDPTLPAQWRWQEAARTGQAAFPPAYCGAAEKVDTAPWGTIVWPGDPVRYSDMAFAITSAPPEPPEYDLGDAPDPQFPTLLASNGARHVIVPGFSLGNLLDNELDGLSDPAALGDDNNNTDDEDGVSLTGALLPGAVSCANVYLTASAGMAPALLDAWIDFDGDGQWQAAEHLFGGTSFALSNGLNTNVCFTVPAGAKSGQTFARFRLSTAGGLSPTGLAADGEVEDYRFDIATIKWSQPPVLEQACYLGWDEFSVYDSPPPEPSPIPGLPQVPAHITADDWICTDSRPITDIHWWGSYENWDEEEPPPVVPDAFHIGIWTDVPAGVDQPWSHPGTMIHEWRVPKTQVIETRVGCDFYPEVMESPDTCYRYDFEIPSEQWFYQNPKTDGIYWISISAIYPVPEIKWVWGWKTRPHLNQDIAVRIFDPTAPHPGDQFKSGQPIDFPAPMDMAFMLTTLPYGYDFGDAPNANYRTLLTSDGARHFQMPSGPFMGILVDAEPDGQPNPTASGDDTNNLKDEDGVTLQSALVPGRSATFDIDMKASPVGCLLSAWIDFDGDGAWTPPIEEIFTDVSLPAGGIVTLPSSMPSSPPAVIGRTYARFRCSTVGGLLSFGPAPDGEVEDLLVEIMAPPKPPEVTISILSATTLKLSWPQVTQDIHGNTRLANGYRIYRDTSPYFTPGAPWVSQWGPGLPNPVTQDANDLGDPMTHHFYIVRAVNMDIMGHTLESADSVRTGEFEFTLVPGSP